MTKNEITRRFPNASAAFIAANLDPENSGPAAVMEHDPGDASLAAETLQGPDRRQFLVRVTAFRRRLLDEDNLCEKYHVDLCRYAGAIPDDAPGQVKIEVGQVKSKHEEILIEIYEFFSASPIGEDFLKPL